MLALVHGKGKRVERAKAKGGKCSPTLELERMGTEQRKRTDTCTPRSAKTGDAAERSSKNRVERTVIGDEDEPSHA